MKFSKHFAQRCVFLLAIVSILFFVRMPALAKPLTVHTEITYIARSVNVITLKFKFSEQPNIKLKPEDFTTHDNKTLVEFYEGKTSDEILTLADLNDPLIYRMYIIGKTVSGIPKLQLPSNSLFYLDVYKVTLIENQTVNFIDLTEDHLANVNTIVEDYGIEKFLLLKIRFFEPPIPEPTMSDFTFNGGLPIPRDFEFAKTDDHNYYFLVFGTIQYPNTLEYKNHLGITLMPGIVSIPKAIGSHFQRITVLIPLSAYARQVQGNVAIEVGFNVVPYPPLTTSDFTIHGGKPLPATAIINEDPVSIKSPLQQIVIKDTTEIPKTLKFRNFPEISLVEDTPVSFTSAQVLPQTAELILTDKSYYILIQYNGIPYPEPKLSDFTINNGQPLLKDDNDNVWMAFVQTKTLLSIGDEDRTVIPKTLELEGYHPLRLYHNITVPFIPFTLAKLPDTDYDVNVPDSSTNIGDGTLLQTEHGADIPAKDKIVINEIANLSGASDWIELLNLSDDSLTLDKWALSIVTEYNDETEIIRFPDISIPAGGILLLVNMDPANTALATGHNVKVNTLDHPPDADENISYLIVKGETNYGFTSPGIDLPDHNDWMLILRSGQPWDVKDGNNVYNSGYQIEDVAGPASITLEIDENEINPPKEKNKDGTEGEDLWSTTVFPLNRREDNGDMLLRFDRTLNEGTVHARDVDQHGFEARSFNPAPFTGIGYDSDITDDGGHLGTPGYPNVTVSSISDLKTGQFIVSELMLTTDGGTYAQWIELHNTSKSEAINLEDPDGDGALTAWKMTIENHNSGSWKRIRRNLHVEVDLSEWFQYIPPQQKVLIAAFADRNSGASDFPSTRVATLWETHRRSFSMIKRGNLFLNASGGFTIKITDSQGNVSDSVGNLDGKAADPDADIGNDDPVGFDWPTELTEDGIRTSLIRLKKPDGSARIGMPTRDETGDATDKKGAALPLGSDESSDTESFAWQHAADINLDDLAKMTWFGSEHDISTPLNSENTMMPVLLSFFRPIMENGEVLIQWTTEAELDNAGFNILRSETRNGHFKRINTQLIQGAGSTAERQTYKWIDTTAKPGTVYYYQIEDVSFSGERYRLATTKLKGLVSAKNKLTTQWGVLKRQD